MPRCQDRRGATFWECLWFNTGAGSRRRVLVVFKLGACGGCVAEEVTSTTRERENHTMPGNSQALGAKSSSKMLRPTKLFLGLDRRRGLPCLPRRRSTLRLLGGSWAASRSTKSTGRSNAWCTKGKPSLDETRNYPNSAPARGTDWTTRPSASRPDVARLGADRIIRDFSPFRHRRSWGTTSTSCPVQSRPPAFEPRATN